jgi:hypothetical protein
VNPDNERSVFHSVGKIQIQKQRVPAGHGILDITIPWFGSLTREGQVNDPTEYDQGPNPVAWSSG